MSGWGWSALSTMSHDFSRSDRRGIVPVNPARSTAGSSTGSRVRACRSV